MNKVTATNYIPKYLLNPLSKKISKLDRAISLIASCALGILTLGLLHLGVALHQWNQRKVKNRTHNPVISQQRVNNTASTVIRPHVGDRASGRTSTTSNDDERVNADQQLSSRQDAWAKDIIKLLDQGKRRHTTRLDEELDKLLKATINPDTIVFEGIGGTALHYTSKVGKPVEFVKIFADNGFNFNHQDEWGNTPLLWAIANGNNEMALEIIKYQQDFNLIGHGNSALHLAIAKGYKDCTFDGALLNVPNIDLVKKMAEGGANPNLKNRLGYTPLHLACIRRDPGMIKALLDAGGDLSILSPNRKNCFELLDTTHEEAKAVMRRVTPPHLLPESDFNANQEACAALISNHIH